MATSLAAQLKRLAVPQTQNLLTADFKQASFLYDDQEAATYSKQHFFNIGVNGLHQLIARDERFAEFEQNLFSQASQSMQRYVQTAEVNKQLDVSINKFLLRLSCYMQLREAHKAMEWMVHRYNVHLRNVDTFMMCMLPYHDQQPFVMALQLLNMNSNEASQWRWLESVKKGGTFLPKQTLITHCRSHKGFLGFLCDMLGKHIEANSDEETGVPSAQHLQRVISFFTQTVLGVLLSGPATEGTISVLLPVLTIGLKAHGLDDYIVSSYMILSQLFLQISLAEKLLQSLLNVISKNIQPSLVQSAVTVIIIMFQKQNISKLPKKAFRNLVRQPLLVTLLQEMSQEAKTDPFLRPFLTTLTKQALKEAKNGCSSFSNAGESSNAEDDDEGPVANSSLMSLLVDLLAGISLNRSIVMEVTRIVLTWFSEKENDSALDASDDNIQNGPFRVFKLLESKYPLLLEETINEMIADPDHGKNFKKTARLLFQISVETAKKNLISDPASSLTICLHHHQSILRQRAVEKVLEDPNLIEDKASLQSTLALKLKDESPDVLRALLKEPKNLWAIFEDKNVLLTSLLECITSYGNMDKCFRKEIQHLILKALCCIPPEIGDEDQICAVVLTTLVIKNSKNVQLATSLLESQFACNNRLLCHVATTWLPVLKKSKVNETCDSEVSSLYADLVDSIKTFLLRDPTDVLKKLESLYKFLLSTSSHGSFGLLILSVCGAVIKETDGHDSKVALQRLMVAILSDMLLEKKMFHMKFSDEDGEELEKDKIRACFSHLQKKKSLPLWLTKDVLQQADIGPVPSSLKNLPFWSLSGLPDMSSSDVNWLNAVTTVVNILLDLRIKADNKCNNMAEESFASFFKVFSDKESVTKFLCMVWMSDSQEGITSTLKAQLLQFAQVFLSGFNDKDKKSLLSESLPFLPCMLILLSSDFESVRKVAFELLALATGPDTKAHQGDSALLWFTRNLLRFREEITKDSAFLSQVLKTLLEADESSASPPSPKKRRRSASKPPAHSSALAWLLENVTDSRTPNRVKFGLLKILHKLDTPESFLPLIPLLKLLVGCLESGGREANEGKATLPTSATEEKEILQLLLKRLTSTIAPTIDQGTEALDTILLALKCTACLGAPASGNTVQLQIIEQLKGRFMLALSLAARKILVAELLTLTALSKSTEVVRRCRKVIKHMSLESSIVIDEMKLVHVKTTASTVREAKRQKLYTKQQSEESEFETLPWKRVTVLLEMLQSKKKVKAAVSLVPVAFQVLGRVHEIESEGSGEYLKQLLLGLINFVCSRHWEDQDDADKAETEQVKGEHLNMDLIVQCIRSSDNAHTHHQALLLLSSAAKIAPSLLLHNMMSVFTFMGANILRQDDAYSFHVISKILDNVIPALIMACEEKSKPSNSSKSKKKGKVSSPDSVSNMMTVVLRVFVDAMPHIPSHRRMVLFEKLIQVMGADQYLWRLILLYIESVTARTAVSKQGASEEVEAVVAAMLPGIEEEKTSGPLSSSDMEFLSGLTEHFSSSQLLVAFQDVLSYALTLPEEKAQGAPLQKPKPSSSLEDMSTEDMAIFSVPSHTPKQLRHFKFATVYALNQLLSSQHIVAQLSETNPTTYLANYQSLLEICLQWISKVTVSLQHHMEDVSRRYWKLLLHKSHDLLDTLVSLLPDSMFFEVVAGLMSHNLALVQRRAMELLNTKLLQLKENDSQDQPLLLSMVSKLNTIASKCLSKTRKEPVNEELLVNGQTALYSLKILCRMLGEIYYNHFVEVLQLCVKALTDHSDNGTIASSSMLCIAEVVSAAKTHSIEHLSLFMPLFVNQLQSESITQHDVLLLATITSLHKVIEVVPLFLSPYLQEIFTQVCIIHSLVETNSEAARKPVVAQKLKLISGTLATATPTRTFLPVVEKSFAAMDEKMASCAKFAMSMLKEHIVTMSREDMTTFSQDLLKFFFVCFDIRITHAGLSEEELDEVEGCVIEAFVTLVFKLSEAQFKPMLLQIYSWATQEDVEHDRVLFFYRLCDSLAEQLKSLFTLFAGHILKHSAQMLDANNKSKSNCRFFGKGKLARTKCCKLVNFITGCLHKTFAHDTEGFMNKERFDIVMQPLVDQLENELGKPSMCEDRAVNYVVPCITSLAAAARDDSLWKDLNYQILLKTRNENAKVRIWALAAVDAFHKQLGEDYTQLVPEAIPFLAELMEDESDEVEKYTQKVLAAMEISVGENLQEYF